MFITFDNIDYIILAIVYLLCLLEIVFKTLAMQNEMVSRIAITNYIGIVYTMIFEIL